MTLVTRTARGVVPTARSVKRRLDRGIGRVIGRRSRTEHAKFAKRGEHIGSVEQQLRGELAELRRELRELKERTHGTELLLGREGRRAHRRPTPRQIENLADQVAELTGDRAAARRQLVLAYRTLVDVENGGVGRVAGGTPNILAKLATTPLLAPRGGAVLEIGTLYGLFAGCLARQLLRAGLPSHLTIVDPIATTQLQNGKPLRMDVSGTPFSEDVIRANLHYAGVAADRLRLVRGYSTDPDIHAALAGETFDVIVVDGDHSREGVAADLAWVESIAAPGAVVVLDDYGDPKWPGVRDAAEDHLAGRGPGGPSRLSMLGQVTTSAFLRAT